MKIKKSKEIFQDFTKELISEEVLEEIETNLKKYFTTLIGWLQANKEGEENEENE